MGLITAGLSSKTMEARDVPGLYIIGEAVDVTGWLGGYNFQWAWSSGWCAGQAVLVSLHRRQQRTSYREDSSAPKIAAIRRRRSSRLREQSCQISE